MKHIPPLELKDLQDFEPTSLIAAKGSKETHTKMFVLNQFLHDKIHSNIVITYGGETVFCDTDLKKAIEIYNNY